MVRGGYSGKQCARAAAGGVLQAALLCWRARATSTHWGGVLLVSVSGSSPLGVPAATAQRAIPRSQRTQARDAGVRQPHQTVPRVLRLGWLPLQASGARCLRMDLGRIDVRSSPRAGDSGAPPG